MTQLRNRYSHRGCFRVQSHSLIKKIEYKRIIWWITLGSKKVQSNEKISENQIWHNFFLGYLLLLYRYNVYYAFVQKYSIIKCTLHNIWQIDYLSWIIFLSKSITIPKCILVYRVEFQLFSTISSRSHGNVMLYIDMLIWLKLMYLYLRS